MQQPHSHSPHESSLLHRFGYISLFFCWWEETRDASSAQTLHHHHHHSCCSANPLPSPLSFCGTSSFCCVWGDQAGHTHPNRSLHTRWGILCSSRSQVYKPRILLTHTAGLMWHRERCVLKAGSFTSLSFKQCFKIYVIITASARYITAVCWKARTSWRQSLSKPQNPLIYTFIAISLSTNNYELKRSEIQYSLVFFYCFIKGLVHPKM